MKNRFKKYLMYKTKNGKIVNVNTKAFNLTNEAFTLLKELYDTNYGLINENENLISIYTGGWADNEQLIEEFKKTSFWFRFHRITATGGHYYFNTDIYSDKEWKIIMN